MRVGVFLFILCCLAVVAPALVAAQQDQQAPPPAATPTPPQGLPEDVVTPNTPKPKPKINNLPFNMYGLTGLMVTTATRTLKPGSFEVGLGGSWEDSLQPAYYRRELAFLGTVGMPAGFEFGLRVPYVMTDLVTIPRFNALGTLVNTYGRSATAGVGSVEGMFKWGFVEQKQFLPAFAVGLGGIAPGTSYSRQLGYVKYYGAKVLLAMGLEVNDLPYTDYAFAILADGELVLRDMGVDNRNYEEKHGMVHGGMVFPLMPRNFLQLNLEYEGVLMLGTNNNQDTNAILGTLRFVLDHFSGTAGAKYTFKSDPDFGDTLSWVATASYTYF